MTHIQIDNLPSLTELAINHSQRSLQHTILAGQALYHAKQLTKVWSSYCRDSLPFGVTMADRYIMTYRKALQAGYLLETDPSKPALVAPEHINKTIAEVRNWEDRDYKAEAIEAMKAMMAGGEPELRLERKEDVYNLINAMDWVVKELVKGDEELEEIARQYGHSV